MDFKEKRLLQKAITENLSKLETGDLSFKEKRDIQKSITADFMKIGEAPKVQAIQGVHPLQPKLDDLKKSLINAKDERESLQIQEDIKALSKRIEYELKPDEEKGLSHKVDQSLSVDELKKKLSEVRGLYRKTTDMDLLKKLPWDIKALTDRILELTPPDPTPTYDKLKSGDFLDLPAAEFIEKLKESADELGVSDSLTEEIIAPANVWARRREGIANEGVGQEDIDYVQNFLNGQEPVEDELIALEDVKTKLNIGDKFKLKGKVSQVNNDESTTKKHNYKSIAVEFPFNNDWVKLNKKFSSYFTLKDDETHPFKLNDEITLDVELGEIKGKKPKKEGDPPVVYYGLNFESPDGFKKQDSDYVNFASEKAVLKHMIGEAPATESAESGGEKPETGVNTESEGGDTIEDPAIESVDDEIEDHDDGQEFELSPEQEEQLVNEMKEADDPGQVVAEEGIATEKAKIRDEKKWKYAKKITLRAMFDKAPSGDNEKDNEVIESGKAWAFVQDQYQKLVSGKIKARKKVATESVDEEIEGEEIII